MDAGTGNHVGVIIAEMQILRPLNGYRLTVMVDLATRATPAATIAGPWGQSGVLNAENLAKPRMLGTAPISLIGYHRTMRNRQPGKHGSSVAAGAARLQLPGCRASRTDPATNPYGGHA
jgi:hypothetical protein